MATMSPQCLCFFLIIPILREGALGVFALPSKHRPAFCGAHFRQSHRGHDLRRLQTRCARLASHRRDDTEDEQRLLLTEPAVAAFVEAEVRAWLLEEAKSRPMERNAKGRDVAGVGVVEESARSVSAAAKSAYISASKEGVLSHHGSLISFLSTELRSTGDQNLSHNLRLLGTDAYRIAKRSVDVLHHRLYRGTYTKTVEIIGVGEDAAREAVGLAPLHKGGKSHETRTELSVEEEEVEDNCLVEPPPELSSTDCLWTESDEAAWRLKRFEKITMEGWRDPRRGNSGTSR